MARDKFKRESAGVIENVIAEFVSAIAEDENAMEVHWMLNHTSYRPVAADFGVGHRYRTADPRKATSDGGAQS